MPMSDYMRGLRARVGTAVLEVPTVSVITLDAHERALLVRHVETGEWTTPGGMIEPYETPADAAVRETWEETGLFVELTRVIAVFGGEPCTTRFANGDELSWVATVFAARPIAGALRPDGDETSEVRYFGRAELSTIRCRPHVALFLTAAYAKSSHAHFTPATWRPPDG